MPTRRLKRPLSATSSRSPSASTLPAAKRQRSGTIRASDYVAHARESIFLKFVRNESELNDLENGFFHPVFTHQLFAKERIIGYKDLTIRIFFTQPHLYAYIQIGFSDKLENKEHCCDIINVFQRWMHAGFTQNKSEFLQKLKSPFNPIGDLHCEYIRPDLEQSADGSESEDIGSDSDDGDDETDDLGSDLSSSGDDSSSADNDDSDTGVNRDHTSTVSNRGRRGRPRRVTSAQRTPNRSVRRRRRSSSGSVSTNVSSSASTTSTSASVSNKPNVTTRSRRKAKQKERKSLARRKALHNSNIVYEIRHASFIDEKMRDFHTRLQFFVLLYIESSSYIDCNDEVWEVMTLYQYNRRRNSYQTLGYLTLYRFFAWPDKNRLRVSQVIIFPPFQRQRHGFELLQQVYYMARYRDFIEVNVEDPGAGFQLLRDVTDVYNMAMAVYFVDADFGVPALAAAVVDSSAVHGASTSADTKKKSGVTLSQQRNAKKNRLNPSQNGQLPKNQSIMNGAANTLNGRGSTNAVNGNLNSLPIGLAPAPVSYSSSTAAVVTKTKRGRPVKHSSASNLIHSNSSNSGSGSGNSNAKNSNSGGHIGRGHIWPMGMTEWKKFAVVTPPDKLPKGIYTPKIMQCAQLLRITPEQARKGFECLRLEAIKEEAIEADNEEETEIFREFRLDVKRRLLKHLQDTEGVQNYDEIAIKSRLAQMYGEEKERFLHILEKRDILIDVLPKWEMTHYYPKWITDKTEQCVGVTAAIIDEKLSNESLNARRKGRKTKK